MDVGLVRGPVWRAAASPVPGGRLNPRAVPFVPEATLIPYDLLDTDMDDSEGWSDGEDTGGGTSLNAHELFELGCDAIGSWHAKACPPCDATSRQRRKRGNRRKKAMIPQVITTRVAYDKIIAGAGRTICAYDTIADAVQKDVPSLFPTGEFVHFALPGGHISATHDEVTVADIWPWLEDHMTPSHRLQLQLFPTPEQDRLLDALFAGAREVWNRAVSLLSEGKARSQADRVAFVKHHTLTRLAEETDAWLAEIPYETCQAEVEACLWAIENGKGVVPRVRNKQLWQESIILPSKGVSLHVTKVKDPQRSSFTIMGLGDRPLEARLKAQCPQGRSGGDDHQIFVLSNSVLQRRNRLARGGQRRGGRGQRFRLVATIFV